MPLRRSLLAANAGDRSHSRIRRRKTCPIHGEVPNDQIVLGYEYAKRQYVIIDTNELDELRTEDDKAITIDTFILAMLRRFLEKKLDKRSAAYQNFEDRSQLSQPFAQRRRVSMPARPSETERTTEFPGLGTPGRVNPPSRT
jgi:hypothetical protein